jgi:hypothetical protein
VILLLVLIIYILWRDFSPQKIVVAKTDTTLGLYDRSLVPNRGRLQALGFTILGLYAISVLCLYLFWYRKTVRTAFHWFEDKEEWNQIDKAGHIFGGYFQTIWGYELLRWCGLDNKKAAIIGAILGTSIQSSIEAMDGYSAKWGASYSDLESNFLGAMIAASQYLLWEEQRIQLKFSYEGNDYPKGELADRAANLFGTGYFERALKDYNNMTLWASINPHKFFPEVYPKWMNVAVGYSAENMYGGFQNIWIDKEGKRHDRSDLPRLRVLNFSLDADLPQLSNGNKAELGIFKMLNIFKVPFPRVQHKWKAGPIQNMPDQTPTLGEG